MSFHHQFTLASARNQLIPQQLTNNVFFGPLNTLSQREFIQENCIRFFVAVGIPTKRVAQYCRDMPVQDCLVVNFDSEFSPQEPLSAPEAELVSQYSQLHSASLSQLAANIAGDIAAGCSADSRLTPQPELDQQLHNSPAHYTCNIVTSQGAQKFASFNDLLTIFKLSGSGNVLVFSSNGNDEDLVALLSSHIVMTNSSASLLEAFQHVKSLRPSIHQCQPDSVFWCQGLMEYLEGSRAYKNPFYDGGMSPASSLSAAGLSSSAFVTKRRNSWSSDWEEECSNVAPGTISASGTPKARKIAAVRAGNIVQPQ
ncbi:LAQU0S01e15214g1_1 [Lachancea quebecensis]|uniref:LAQU0S01e15214g1_1 n=1 Tax=Lachancea quebecensis TaxID=1654605 RepID=A0A0P1KN29_9SACH|nr:LAQU0S01e15214g1_1 [Lachancea quebecensis]